MPSAAVEHRGRGLWSRASVGSSSWRSPSGRIYFTRAAWCRSRSSVEGQGRRWREKFFAAGVDRDIQHGGDGAASWKAGPRLATEIKPQPFFSWPPSLPQLLDRGLLPPGRSNVSGCFSNSAGPSRPIANAGPPSPNPFAGSLVVTTANRFAPTHPAATSSRKKHCAALTTGGARRGGPACDYVTRAASSPGLRRRFCAPSSGFYLSQEFDPPFALFRF